MTPAEMRMHAALEIVRQELADSAQLDRLRLHAFVVRAIADARAALAHSASTGEGVMHK